MSKSYLMNSFQESYCELFHSLCSEKTIVNYYHMTIQYKNHEKGIDCLERTFTKFYMSKLLPYLMRTRDYQELRLDQPITMGFIEKGKTGRLHTHSIIASTKYTVEALDNIFNLCEQKEIGSLNNELLNSYFKFKDIESVKITKPDLRTILGYITKDVTQFESHFHLFPDRLVNP